MGAVGRQVRANLHSGRRQTVLVAVTVLGASALLTVALSTFGAASDAFEQLHQRVAGAHLWLDLDPGVVTDDAALATLRSLEGVTAATEPRPTVATRLRVGTQQQWLHLRDWPGDDVPVARTLVVDGRPPAAGRTNEFALDRNLADHLGVAVDDEVEVLGSTGWEPVRVVGRTVSADMCPAPMCEPVISHLAAGGLAATGLQPPPQPDAARTAIGLRLTDPDDHAAVQRAAAAALPPGAIVAATDHASMAEFADFMLRIESVFLTAFGLVAAIAAGLLIANAIADAVRTDTRRIGLLKAVGFTRAQLLRTYLTQHLGAALAASVAGTAVGAVLARWSLSGVAAQFAQGGRGTAWWSLVVVPAIVVTIAGTATWRPVRRAGRVDAMTAIRTGAAAAPRHPARLARLPVPLAIALVDLRARPGRSLLTAATLSLAAITLAFASTVLTTLGDVNEDPAAGFVPPGELLLERPEVLGDVQVRALLADQPAVEAVRGSRWLQWNEAGGEERFGAFAVDGDVEAFPMPLIDGRMATAPGEVVVGYGLSTYLDLTVGDPLVVVVAGQTLDLEVTGTYRELFSLGRMLHTPAGTFDGLDDDAQADTYLLALVDGADPDAVARSLAAASDDLLAAAPPTSFAEPVLDTLPAVMLGLTVVLSGIALIGVLNAVWAGVQERTRELGLLVAVGMRGRQLLLSVMAGAGVLALLGAVVGLPLGVALSRGLLDGLGRGLGFGPLSASIAWPQLVLILPLIVLVALLGAWPPARRATRLSVVEAVRAE